MKRTPFGGEERISCSFCWSAFCKTISLQTGNGTLTPDQVQLLRRGFIALTSSPQAVGIFDITRLPTGAKVSPAIVFYLNSVGTSQAAQTEGYSFLHIVPGRGDAGVNVRVPAEDSNKLIACLPNKLKSVLLVTAFTHSEEHLLDYTAHQQQKRTEASFKKGVDYIFGQSVRETVRLLEEKGLDRSVIPMRVGGDYFYTRQFDQWIRTRLSMEDCMGGAPPVRNTGILNSVVKQATKRALLETAQRVVDEAATISTDASSSTKKSNRGRRQVICQRLPGESEEEFEKRRMFVYGKRSYERKRHKLPQLQEQFQALDHANQRLRSNNRTLEVLVVQAREIVSMYEKGPPQLEPRSSLSIERIQDNNQDNDSSHDDDDDLSIGSLSFLELV